MKLYIDSRDNKKIILAIKEKTKTLFYHQEEIASKKQAEKLLLAIDNLFKENKIKWSQIKEIEVNNEGGSFTGLRLGVIVANTLAYTKNIKVQGSSDKNLLVEGIEIVKPLYDKDPDITVSKKKLLN